MMFNGRFLSSLFFILVLFVNTNVSITTQVECDAPPHILGQVYIYENNNNCYYVFNTSAPRLQTKFFCCGFNAHFLWIESLKEEQFLSDMLKDLGKDNIRIGLKKLPTETIWESCYQNKTKPVIYENWLEKSSRRWKTFVRYNVSKTPVWVLDDFYEDSLPVICEKCKPGFYGENCDLECGHCQDLLCDPINGMCYYGCNRGWLGETCRDRQFDGNIHLPNNEIPLINHRPDDENLQSDFIPGQFDGNIHLPNNEIPVINHRPEEPYVNQGRFPFPEEPGRSNPYFPGNQYNLQECADGYYGERCQLECYNCLNGICNAITGDCLNGCIAGYFGKKCDIAGNPGQLDGNIHLPNNEIPLINHRPEEPYVNQGTFPFPEEPGSNNLYFPGNQYNLPEGPGSSNLYLPDFIGCFADRNNRAMDKLFVISDTMTVEWCKKHCHKNGYKYAALQYGKQCFCGNGGFQKYRRSNNCNMRCAGNMLEICGGTWANSVYKVGDSIGCFADKRERAMNAMFSSSTYMTVEWCKGYCRNNGYMYAALQYGKQCFCGNDGYNIHGISDKCNIPCSGNRLEICGGIWANSVYNVGDFIGCFADGRERAMNAMFTSSTYMTVKRCKRYCRENSYMYAALQYGEQCFCGNGGYEIHGISDKCKMPCPGSPHEICGGIWANSVYKVGEEPGSNNLYFPGNQYNIPEEPGSSNPYYPGNQYNLPGQLDGNIHLPNNEIQVINHRPDDDNPQSDFIPGLYGDPGKSLLPDYIGCFADKRERAMNAMFTSSIYMTVRWCKGYCRNNGYMYAAVQYGKQCFCGNDGYNIHGISDNCKMPCSGNRLEICGGIWANSVYKVGDFIGCFADGRERAMNAMFTSSTYMTVKRCKRYCRENSYMYAALQYGEQCFCGNGGYEIHGISDKCKMPCPGSPHEICGGIWANSVYKVGGSSNLHFPGNQHNLPGQLDGNIHLPNNEIPVINHRPDDDNLQSDFIPEEPYVNQGRFPFPEEPYVNQGRFPFPEEPGSSHLYFPGNQYNLPDYIGCFADKRERAMNAMFTSSIYMTVRWCKGYCRNNGYMYAAVQYGKQCFCGNDGYNIHGISDNCKMPCSGNRLEICGGIWANSVYKVGDFIGCFADGRERAMNAMFTSSTYMTVKRCKRYCRENSYMYAALQYGEQCFCGNGGYEIHGISDKCKMPCPGSPHEICGGIWANSVYKVGEEPYVNQGRFPFPEEPYVNQGRFPFPEEPGSNNLYFPEEPYVNQGRFPLPEESYVNQGRFPLPGQLDGTMYLPDNEIPVINHRLDDDNLQSDFIPGLYGDPGKSLLPDYIGCFADGRERAMNAMFTSSIYMTVEWCKGYCRNNGYMYAAIQYGKQCFCGNDGYNIHGISDKCKMPCSGNRLEICGGIWANSVYKVGDFIGCFVDKRERAMHAIFTSSLYMTVEWCKGYCQENGYMYAALQYGKQCFCGNGGYNIHGISNKCNTHCSGSPHEICGGSWANSVYRVGDSIGCFKDNKNRAMDELHVSFKYMTVEWCKGYCHFNGYMYAALQYGHQCFCGHGGYKKYGRSRSCNMRCAGNSHEICGGLWANFVYKVGDFIGCFGDTKNRALKDMFALSETMTVKWCKGYCHDNGYKYAALQYGKKCFCGNGGYNIHGISNNCKMPCPGSPNEICGGRWANSVYKVGVTPYYISEYLRKKETKTGDYRRGEYYGHMYFQGDENLQNDEVPEEPYGNITIPGEENLEPEHLPDEISGEINYLPGYVACLTDYTRWKMRLIGTYKDLTIPFCTNECEVQGYTYAAFQHGNGCFCGDDTFKKHFVKSTHCNKKCSGNNQTLCGGHKERSLYKVEGYVGCYIDENNITITKYVQGENSLTVTLCKTECRNKGYKYAVLQSGSECFCGDETFDESSESRECIKPCNGDETQICGGTVAKSVYKVGDHIGCFKTYENQGFSKQFIHENMTIPLCKGNCRMNGTEFAALKNSTICVCMNQIHGANIKASECNEKCGGEYLSRCGGLNALSIYKVGDYIGCFKDKGNRSLQFQESNKSMTVKMCQQLCSKKGFKYAGLQFGLECYCGNDNYDKYGASKECIQNCLGNTHTKCGGNWAMSVYVAKDFST